MCSQLPGRLAPAALCCQCPRASRPCWPGCWTPASSATASFPRARMRQPGPFGFPARDHHQGSCARSWLWGGEGGAEAVRRAEREGEGEGEGEGERERRRGWAMMMLRQPTLPRHMVDAPSTVALLGVWPIAEPESPRWAMLIRCAGGVSVVPAWGRACRHQAAVRQASCGHVVGTRRGGFVPMHVPMQPRHRETVGLHSATATA